MGHFVLLFAFKRHRAVWVPRLINRHTTETGSESAIHFFNLGDELRRGSYGLLSEQMNSEKKELSSFWQRSHAWMAVGLLFGSKHRSVGLLLYTAGMKVLQLETETTTFR